VYYIHGLDVTEEIFAVLYVSIMGLTRFYKTTVFCIYCLHNGANSLLGYRVCLLTEVKYFSTTAVTQTAPAENDMIICVTFLRQFSLKSCEELNRW